VTAIPAVSLNGVGSSSSSPWRSAQRSPALSAAASVGKGRRSCARVSSTTSRYSGYIASVWFFSELRTTLVGPMFCVMFTLNPCATSACR
jgi:hypothetical protein